MEETSLPASDPSTALISRKRKRSSSADHYLVTDASRIGWGAVLNNMSLWGKWTAEQKKTLNSDEKEMIAVYGVLLSHKQLLESKSIHLQCDNLRVVSHLRRERFKDTDTLKPLTTKVLKMIDEYNIKLSTNFIPGNFNYHADYLSRQKKPPEWHILPEITKELFQELGTPSIDLFASSTAHVVPKYCTPDPEDKSAVLYDAFSINWQYDLAWVFPPPHLIPKVLAHLDNASGTYLVVAPTWKGEFWRTDLMKRALSSPIKIRNMENVLINTRSGKPPRTWNKITLEIWKFRGGMDSTPNEPITDTKQIKD